MKRSQAVLDEMVDKAAWKRPEQDALTADQLDRFLQVRQRIDHGRARLRRPARRAAAQAHPQPRRAAAGPRRDPGRERRRRGRDGRVRRGGHDARGVPLARAAGLRALARGAAAGRHLSDGAARGRARGRGRRGPRERSEAARPPRARGRRDEVAHPRASRGPELGHPRSCCWRAWTTSSATRWTTSCVRRSRCLARPRSVGRPGTGPSPPTRGTGGTPPRRPRAAASPRRPSARASARPSGAPATRSSSRANAASLCPRCITR